MPSNSHNAFPHWLFDNTGFKFIGRRFYLVLFWTLPKSATTQFSSVDINRFKHVEKHINTLQKNTIPFNYFKHNWDLSRIRASYLRFFTVDFVIQFTVN